MKPQYQRMFEAAKERQELPSALDMYSRALHRATLVDGPDEKWIRIDSVVRSEEDVFRYIAYALDCTFARDTNGNIYVTKDHALNISQSQHEKTEKKLDVARNWAVMLAVLVGVALVGRCMG